jgi:hypothetical protein
VKSELDQVKSELDQVKRELAKLRSPGEQRGRYQLFMSSKGESAYLFDPQTGEVLRGSLRPGTDNWGIAVRGLK